MLGLNGKWPLKTTSENLESHQENIPFGALPKTFQDAVIVTNAIGLQFLWIDSLCIVQDDKAEWQEESAVMGAIYENARLTISACAAKDSTEGCFRSIRHSQQTVDVPYYSMIDKTDGIFYIGANMSYDPSPDWSPLRDRGWAVQEWRLSRRLLHFTRGGLSWQCNRLQVCERGVQRDFNDYPEWDSLIETYCRCQLTFETDRLIALQGLATEMQKESRDQYHAGIWEAHLPLQLLWMNCRSLVGIQNQLIAPSWSWASQPGSKVVWETLEDLEDAMILASCNMVTQNPSKLVAIGPLKQCAVTKSGIFPNGCVVERYLNHCPEVASLIDLREEAPLHHIHATGRRSPTAVGLALSILSHIQTYTVCSSHHQIDLVASISIGY